MRSSRDLALATIKTAHTAIWLLVEAAVLYVLLAGIRGRSDGKVAIAGAVVATETMVFLGNGARCPLTDLAESLGADDGSVTDIFLPRWLAHYLPAIHVPLVGAAMYLHGRAILGRSRAG